MITFEVNDMTCGHCAGTITKAVKDLDKDARVHIDLATHQVAIESETADLQQLSDAIKDAGYTAAIVNMAVTSAVESAAPERRCGCSCG